ncbi:MAG: type II toxin-antitoxin system RatA family toxin [Gammaproteobacteria bacterium]|nr:type II toxin-antitoxin system RatA family toxin [Gammaproteobacteria bacterium]
MTTINRSALVPFSANDMFKLVDDIERYAEFLPWCKSTNIIDRATGGNDNSGEVIASIDISKAGIHKTFTTRNINTNASQIEMNLVDGPFKSLHGYWRFTALNESACKVSLDIEFDFSNQLLSMTLGPVFSQICNSLVNAFVGRAAVVYGRN